MMIRMFEQLKSSFSKWIRKNADKVARHFYEGPDAPPRLFDEIEVFEKLHPDASPSEWRAFVQGAVSGAYRDGYVRGYEHKERLPQSSDYEAAKWLETEAHRHDWSLWQGQPTSLELRRRFEEQRSDPFAGMTPEQRIRAFEAIGRYTGEFKVVWPGEDDPTPWASDVERGA